MPEYITFDRQSDALASLHEFTNCMKQFSNENLSLKYAIISIHNALQGYICISLANGNSFQTWSAKNVEKWLSAYRANVQLPTTKLDYFMELYDKLFLGEPSLSRENINWLNDTRNNLIHFNNDSFGVHLDSALLCFKEAINAIKLCPKKSKGLFFYSDEQMQSFGLAVQSAEVVLEACIKKT